jgi:HlyD family secretion protein
MKKRLIPIILAVVVLAIAGGFLWSQRNGRDEANRIRLSGNMELTQVDISFKVPGKLIERAVNEGDTVKKGQLIARIDQLQTMRQNQAQQASVQSAEMQLAQSGTSVAWQQATNEADIELRKADIRQAQANLDQLLNGSRPEEIQQAQAAVADARTQAEQARLDWERAQTLYKNDDISTAQRDQYQARFNSTAALLRQAEERLALVKEGPRKEEIAAARAALAQRARSKAQARRSGCAQSGHRPRQSTTRRHRIAVG